MYGPPIVIYRLVKYYDYFYEETGKIKYSFKNIQIDASQITTIVTIIIVIIIIIIIIISLFNVDAEKS